MLPVFRRWIVVLAVFGLALRNALRSVLEYRLELSHELVATDGLSVQVQPQTRVLRAKGLKLGLIAPTEDPLNDVLEMRIEWVCLIQIRFHWTSKLQRGLVISTGAFAL